MDAAPLTRQLLAQGQRWRSPESQPGSGRQAALVSRPTPCQPRAREVAARNFQLDRTLAAQELATWVETNDRWPVSRQLANAQVSSMSSGQTKGDLTPGRAPGVPPQLMWRICTVGTWGASGRVRLTLILDAHVRQAGKTFNCRGKAGSRRLRGMLPAVSTDRERDAVIGDETGHPAGGGGPGRTPWSGRAGASPLSRGLSAGVRGRRPACHQAVSACCCRSGPR